MKRLARYLKPFLVGILIAFVVLFLRAFSELGLPNYMSQIVNVGIQQYGIEHAAPDEISDGSFDTMTPYFSGEDIAIIKAGYAEEGDKWVRQVADAETLAELDEAFGRAAVAVAVVAKSMGDGGEMSPETLNLLPAMTESASPEAIMAAQIVAAEAEPATLKQAGILFVRMYYAELGKDLAGIQRGFIIRTGLIMLLIALIGGASTVAVSFLASKISAGVAKNIRRDTFAKIERFSSDEFDRFSTASLITRCTNDVTQVQMLVSMGIQMICYSPIMAVGGIVMAVRKAPSMSWIIALAFVVILALIVLVMSVATPRFKIIQSLVDKLNLVSRENLNGLMVIRAFRTQSFEEARFDSANNKMTQTSTFINRIMALMPSLMSLIMNGLSVLIVWIGAKQIAAANIQVGDMMAYIQYMMQIVMSFLMISIIFFMVPRAAVSAHRIAEVLDTDESIRDSHEPGQFVPALRGVVEFRDVSFRYHGAEEDALSAISFTAEPGKTTAIIGATGSGKTTIANLIMRFYDATGGSVRVDGADVRDVMQDALREKIGYVPQKGQLFSGTIASNIAYGKQDASHEEIQKAAEIAQAASFISEKPEKYEEAIAQGGGNVSGGQRQRLSIARAVAKKPDVFIFDDSFSALDYQTDAKLRAALRRETGDSTVIVVAQRVSTIMDADLILVLEKGRIIGRGTHAELLKNCAEYLEIASSQLSKEELA